VRKLGSKAWRQHTTKKTITVRGYRWRNEKEWGFLYQGYELKVLVRDFRFGPAPTAPPTQPAVTPKATVTPKPSVAPKPPAQPLSVWDLLEQEAGLRREEDASR
jgi:hypothetical protein